MSVCHMFHRATLLTQDDVTADESSRMNSEINRAVLSAQIQQNAVKLIGQCFRVEIDNRPKTLKYCERYARSSPKSLQTNRKLKAGALKVWQSIPRDDYI